MAELIMVVPTPDGVSNDLVLAAAAVAGVDRVFAVGGAQAVAALAYGTETVPKVDKIVGPGNIYVATAKGMVFGAVGIDMIAGPSEILVVCDGQTDPDWIATTRMLSRSWSVRTPDLSTRLCPVSKGCCRRWSAPTSFAPR